MSEYGGRDPFDLPVGGQAAADRGQAAADRGQAAADRGQAAADRGQAAADLGKADRGDQRSAAATVLRASLDSLILESQALRTDVRAAEAQRAREMSRRRQENLAMFGLLGVLSLLMLLMLTVAWQNNQLSQEVRHNAAQLTDCTTPGGECYQRGQARTGQAVRTLQLIQLYIVECSRALPVNQYPPGPEFDRVFEKCVADRVAAQTAAEQGGTARPGQPGVRPSPSPTGGRR